MPDAPRVSIVMPSFNRAALVGDAIRSIVAQDMRNWELLLVDDGSQDDTIARVEAMGDPRVQILASPHLGHIARLRNLGAAQARGSWLAFLDSDDLWLPGKLAAQLAALAASGADWSYADHGVIDAAGHPGTRRAGAFAPLSGRILHALLREETSAFIGTLLVRRTLFEALGGFDESLRMRDDLDLVLRIAAAGDAVALPNRFALVREHPGRTTRSLADPHERTALVFERLIARGGDPEAVAIARSKRRQLLAAAAIRHLRSGKAFAAVRLLARFRPWAGPRSSR